MNRAYKIDMGSDANGNENLNVYLESIVIRMEHVFENESVSVDHLHAYQEEFWKMLKNYQQKGGSRANAYEAIANLQLKYVSILDKEDQKYELLYDVLSCIWGFCPSALSIWREAGSSINPSRSIDDASS